MRNIFGILLQTCRRLGHDGGDANVFAARRKQKKKSQTKNKIKNVSHEMINRYVREYSHCRQPRRYGAYKAGRRHVHHRNRVVMIINRFFGDEGEVRYQLLPATDMTCIGFIRNGQKTMEK